MSWTTLVPGFFGSVMLLMLLAVGAVGLDIALGERQRVWADVVERRMVMGSDGEIVYALRLKPDGVDEAHWVSVNREIWMHLEEGEAERLYPVILRKGLTGTMYY